METSSPSGRTAYLTNSMEQIPSWEANSHSDNQEFLRLLRNAMVHFRVRKSSPLVFVLNQIHISIFHCLGRSK